MRRDLLILGWHNVEGTWCFPSEPGRGLRGLAAQLRWVRRLGNVVDLGQALATIADGRTLPPRSIALTFDDGYRDNLTMAAPLLRELELPATFFLVPGVLSGLTAPWWEALAYAFASTRQSSLQWGDEAWSLVGTDGRIAYDRLSSRLKRLDRPSRDAAVAEIIEALEPEGSLDMGQLFLDWEGARQLVGAGVAIGSHSRDHAILANEAPEGQRANLTEARRELETELGIPIDLLAYPNGTADDFDAVTEEAAREAGYRCGVTTIPGWNSATTGPYRLRRYVLYPERGPRAFKPVATGAVAKRRSAADGA
jgi:peptidoglycan/xylan/chitin deacetylase (PgdA/CDA1 family)